VETTDPKSNSQNPEASSGLSPAEEGVSFDTPSSNESTGGSVAPTIGVGGHIDPASFLLPQKKPAVPQQQGAPAPSTPKQEPATSVPATPPEEPQSEVQPLRTFRADIEQTIQKTNASLTSIAAAESTRRTALDLEGRTVQKERVPFPIKKVLTIFVALLFILGGIGALSFLFLKKEPEGIVEIVAPTSFISIDEIAEFPMGEKGRADILGGLVTLRSETALPVGLVRAIYPTLLASTTKMLVPTSSFLTTISPQFPPLLARALRPDFMLGIHSFEENQPFLILKVTAYEQAFAGMLAWELFMPRDLAPLFTRNPRPRTQGEGAASSSPFGFFETPFTDLTIGNRDTRVYMNEAGDIVLLYVFLDRETILITTNENTLQEIISRLRDAPRL